MIAPSKPGTSRRRENFERGASAVGPFSQRYRNGWEIMPTQDSVSIAQLVTMRRLDGQARGLYRVLTQPILAALRGAHIVPVKGEVGGDEEADFIEKCLLLPHRAGGMITPFNRVMAQILLGVFDGFSAFEMVYQRPKYGPLAGKFTPLKLAYRPAETVRFVVDDHGNFNGLHQRVMHNGRYVDADIDAEDSFYWAAQEEERAYYGRSYFDAAFQHWDWKFRAYHVMHTAAQRAALGTRVGKYPGRASNDERDDFRDMLADSGFAQSITIPDDYIVELLKESINFDFISLIEHHNKMMSQSLVASFFDDSSGGSSGPVVDFGKKNDSFFLLVLQKIMEEIKQVIDNAIIPKFVDWNFTGSRYPQFQWGELTEDQRGATAEMFRQLVAATSGSTLTQEFMRAIERKHAEEMGLDIDYEAIAERESAAGESGVQAPGFPGGVPVPDGFQLTVPVPEDAIGLVRYVRTHQGSQRFRRPIGTPITGRPEQDDSDHSRPDAQGAGQTKVTDTVGTRADTAAGRSNSYSHPKATAKLIDFGDGTLALDYGNGVTSPRQRSDLEAWGKLGWQVQPPPEPDGQQLGGDKGLEQDQVRKEQLGKHNKGQPDELGKKEGDGGQ